MTPAPPCENQAADVSKIEGVPPIYWYIYTSLPRAQCVNYDTYTNDSMRVNNVIPGLLTDEGKDTG
jgi:hypothetical protein